MCWISIREKRERMRERRWIEGRTKKREPELEKTCNEEVILKSKSWEMLSLFLILTFSLSLCLVLSLSLSVSIWLAKPWESQTGTRQWPFHLVWLSKSLSLGHYCHLVSAARFYNWQTNRTTVPLSVCHHHHWLALICCSTVTVQHQALSIVSATTNNLLLVSAKFEYKSVELFWLIRDQTLNHFTLDNILFFCFLF